MIAKGFQSGTQILMLYCTTQLGILHMYIVQGMGQAASLQQTTFTLLVQFV